MAAHAGLGGAGRRRWAFCRARGRRPEPGDLAAELFLAVLQLHLGRRQQRLGLGLDVEFLVEFVDGLDAVEDLCSFGRSVADLAGQNIRAFGDYRLVDRHVSVRECRGSRAPEDQDTDCAGRKSGTNGHYCPTQFLRCPHRKRFLERILTRHLPPGQKTPNA